MKRLGEGKYQSKRIDPPQSGPDFVVIANRLPVDRDTSVDPPAWRTSPGGLVTALDPVMSRTDGAWVGWAGQPDEDLDPFDKDGIHIVPVTLTATEVRRYYEGFSNATLWPLFHDVIVPPEYHRTWWDAYRDVNERFAHRAAEVAATDATVWVNDYQLLLVPLLLRAKRPDLKIGFFNHIPFPAWELFSQLPWRKEILTGIQGADLIGFQRPSDAANFRSAVRNLCGTSTRGERLTVPAQDDLGVPGHTSIARHFPISVDTESLQELVADPAIIERAAQIRRDLGNPDIVMLGVDRLDYTKGIRHRIKAFEELLRDKRLNPESVTLVQVATPSRERVEQYKQIRHDVELAVGRINGEFSDLNNQVVHYLHHSYPRDQMVALFLAADVCLVTALRDGMNLVAKEYVACRLDDTGALVLSEFTGAADQLTQALKVNPHDIDNMKNTIVRACELPPKEQRHRMRLMRKRLEKDTVHVWSRNFLDALEDAATHHSRGLPQDLKTAIERLAQASRLTVALDFDGVLAPLVDDPYTSAPLPGSAAEVRALSALKHTRVALVSGRNLDNLFNVYEPPAGTLMYGSHGSETAHVLPGKRGLEATQVNLTDSEETTLEELENCVEEFETRFADSGAWIERKPLGRTFHWRTVKPEFREEVLAHIQQTQNRFNHVRQVSGHDILELTVRHVTKGDAVNELTTSAPEILYVGDDITDEDAFAALAQNPNAVTVKVGEGETRATYRVNSPADVTDLLFHLRVAREQHQAQ
ncbi:bifunctional alpha,alpha-trehalose-phosphate synthase (UDP-forming)/trehalose-phosphatase [Brevibacterium sp. UMB1308A]|uniref:bifunctional alpha,alpha-trehalose-phosphate synthase (UDP-forming)/trehalose-phosphatase n=1 Tax=Brevibacterium sp. UMB1308A TaxID=3050608 RepID=UPI0025505BEF|nr:bifunctional alpha,alpha-trehalose-phosphate synthase (UDP-forming)/trehalose-phosphatase [Brevibacterium sp. UMB1308A]MDK8346168.1 bifunctional alpha,alpha-trehalose-phosphate synthase (UDP-forming)/trehalose-phosphatase [Brevibacterium sp. UMB1308B]MDK8712398.1 bifunctional alpha,alpha-trehalose-phosphate synthase (UDP-forming)/trehalose-phosphatase [Brevibacterium sp. UMB1308A]